VAFVLDASITIAWVIGKQATPYSRAIRLRAKREPYHAPALWQQEVVNVIGSLTRRRAISIDAGRTAVDILERMQPVLHNTALSLPELLGLASRYDLSAYDASYLALAMQLKLPLACSDSGLRAALSRAGVKLA
jgi:predicted nucleic acid-binding protein